MKEWAFKLLATLLVIFAPAKAMVLTTIALVFVDLVLGLLAARHRHEPITSSSLKRTAVKLFIYPAAILLGFLVQQYLTGPDIPISNIISGMIGMTELLSCLENLNEISGESVLTLIINKLSSTRNSKQD